MKNLIEALQWLFDAMKMWLQCVVKPVATLNDILPKATDEKHLSAAEKVWVSSLLISLIISFPVLKLYGIQWNDVGYHLCTLMTTIVALITTAFIAHHVLLGLKLKSEFVPTLVIYTVIVATYAPVSNLLGIPSTLTIFAAVHDFKQHPIAIGAAVTAYIWNSQNLQNFSSFVGVILNVAFVFSLVLSYVIVMLFAESISQWYSNNRFKCYSAVCVSMLLSAIVTVLIVLPAQILIIYSWQ